MNENHRRTKRSYFGRFFPLALAFVLAAPAAASGLGGGGEPIQRFVLAAGANDGGEGRVRLRYAGRDAEAMVRLMEDLGGVPTENRIVVLDPTRDGLQRAMRSLSRKMEAARDSGDRLEFFFYYSGHSDEEGLLLREERFGYDELRWFLESLPSDVRVAILDSCASGAITRSKGGVRRPAFLVDASSAVKGHAFLTSSSADEVAQESDRIRGSYFTHHLLAGLRGAADTRSSGTVTLTDAYRYAFQETLAHTERTLGGAQHPAYEMQLVGTGDLVITDLRNTSAGLALEAELAGRIYVRDASGHLVVEVRKLDSVPMELGIPPGTYEVTVSDGAALYEGTVVLEEDRRTVLEKSRLRRTTAEPTSFRGGALPGERAGEGEPRVVPFELSFAPGLGTDFGGHPKVSNLDLHLLGSKGDRLDGAQIGLGMGAMDGRVEGVQLALVGNLAGADVSGLQASIGYNQVAGELEGVQLAVGANRTGGDVRNVQLAVGANIAEGSVDGVQAAVGLSLAAGSFQGAQLATGAAIAGGPSEGIQAAVGLAYAGSDHQGVQLATGAAITGGRLEGLQMAAGLSYGRAIDGSQISVINAAGSVNGGQIGVINFGGSVDGAQIGVINLGGRIDGLQLGVLNFADESETSIGVLSFVRNGRLNLGLWAADLGTANLGIKTGTKSIYSLVFGGIAPEREDGEVMWTFGAGLGTQFRTERPWLNFLDLDLLVSHVFHGDQRFQNWNEVLSLRVGGGWRLADRLAIVAGPTVNASVQWGRDREALSFLPGWELQANRDRATVRIWPGLFAGIEI